MPKPALPEKRCPRTIPINGDSAFLALVKEVDGDAVVRGFPGHLYKGSASWVAGRDPGERGDVLLKLAFYGADEPFFFGIRDSLCVANGMADLPFPAVRGIPPKTQATFWGILLSPDPAQAIRQVRKLLSFIPKKPPAGQVSPMQPNAGLEAEFWRAIDERRRR